MIITFSSLKGGCGKSTTTILLANCLAARGKSILLVDFDINNSLSLFYTIGVKDCEQLTQEHNLYVALNKNDCRNEIIETNTKNIKLIPSSVNLCDLRAIEYRRFSKIIKAVENDYDFIIIDTPPTYDNHCMSAIYAADIIFTPLDLDFFSISTSSFLQQKMIDELSEKASSWYFIVNSWKSQFEGKPNSIQSQFYEEFERRFDNILTIKIPKVSAASKYKDVGEKLNLNSKYSVGSRKLALSINQLANSLCELDPDDTSSYVEEF